MKTYKKWINNALGKYIVLTFIIIGVLLALFGLLAFSEGSRGGIIFTNLGSVIIGGGFFSALTKTKHYTDFFQNRIFDVFFNPAEHISQDVLKEKWLILTKNILQRITNSFHEDATKEIFERYLNIQSDYHYADMQVVFDIELIDNKIHATQIITHKLIPTSNKNKIPFSMSFMAEPNKCSTTQLKEVIIDNKKYNQESILESKDNDGNRMITIYLDASSKKEFRVERVFRLEQNVLDDPMLLTEYSRFIKGLEVKYKAKNCNIHFIPFGKSNYGCSSFKKTIDISGYTRIIISNPDELTLPWQGFTLIITPSKNNAEE